jgi:hypothetical protein
MKRIVVAGIALAGLFVVIDANTSLAQTTGPGPGAGGSVLNDPLAPSAPVTPSSAPPSQTPKYVESILNQAAPQQAPAPNAASRFLRPFEEKPDPNQDVQVKKELGPWMIVIQAYTSPEAPAMARQMVSELRTAYQLPAYTFNYGTEERRKEHERVRALIEQQKEFLAKNGLPTDQPIRIRTFRIEEQVGVLVGGYPTEDAAKRDLANRIRKLKPLDPKQVMLDKKTIYTVDEKNKEQWPVATKAMEGYVNPFLGACVVHNPTFKQERPADWDKPDMKQLHRLNDADEFSLLNCKKPFTLAVKDFLTPTGLEQKTPTGSFLEKLTGGKSGPRVDEAAACAHSLAGFLRKTNLEAYVLHTRYYSLVCVGGFDGADDPRLQSMRTVVETKVMPQIRQYMPLTSQTLQPGQFAPSVLQGKIMPMPVPR